MIDIQSVPKSILEHVVDVHCHPTDSSTPSDAMQNLPITICAMSTKQDDQVLVRELAKSYPDRVIPCFGYHPWFTHWISLEQEEPSREDHYRSLFLNHNSDKPERDAFDRMLSSLPRPILLKDLLVSLRGDLEAFPTAMLGEVGLDRIFRVPFNYKARDRQLSPFTVPVCHQRAILEAQINIAVELRRNVSFHSVKSPQHTLEVLADMKVKHGSAWTQISVDMHSCGLSAEVWRNIQNSHTNIFLSLSTAINNRSLGYKTLISAASPDRILVESDIHEVGQCAQRTWDMLCLVADVQGWQVEQTWESDILEEDYGAVRRLEENWKSFRKGWHKSVEQLREERKTDKLRRKHGFYCQHGNISDDDGLTFDDKLL